MTMIIGIEFLCDNHLKDGPLISQRFHVGKDRDGDPLITFRCPKCGELIELVFIGTAAPLEE